MNNAIKERLPEPFVEQLKNIRNYGRSISLFRRDKRRFLQHFSKKNSLGKEQLKAQLLFFSHSVEKGLSREKFRYGFGKTVIPELYKRIKSYHAQGYDLEDKIYLNALSVLNQYIQVHEVHHYDLTDRISVKEFKENYLKLDLKIGGVKRIKQGPSKENQEKNFKELAMERHSVRDYQESPIDLKKINEAIWLATKSPSVCNRQSSRVRVIKDPQVVEKALKIQGGFKGYNIPPCLLLITTDSRYFIDITERNQIYVDGGLFAMSLLYALEYQGLAACSLNTMFDLRRECDTRKLLKIKESENLIMYISVGNFKKEYKVPLSHRLNQYEITTYI